MPTRVVNIELSGPYTPLPPSGFGQAFVGNFARAGPQRRVVIKIQQHDQLDENLLNEWLALTLVPEHNHVLQTIGVCEDFRWYGPEFVRMPPRVALVTEFMTNGSIEDFLKKPGNEGQAQRHIMEWALHIASGLAHLHSHNLVHRDVAARNVFLDADCRGVVGDFGLLRRVANAQGKTYYKVGRDGNLQFFLPPEVFEGWRFSFASDMFSLGLTLFEIATQCDRSAVPFPSMLDADEKTACTLLAQSAEKGYQELFGQLPSWCPAKIKTLMLRCLAFDPTKRPTAADVVLELSGSPFVAVKAQSRTNLDEAKLAWFIKKYMASGVRIKSKQVCASSRVELMQFCVLGRAEGS